jgi:hypothetical protein
MGCFGQRLAEAAEAQFQVAEAGWSAAATGSTMMTGCRQRRQNRANGPGGMAASGNVLSAHG